MKRQRLISSLMAGGLTLSMFVGAIPTFADESKTYTSVDQQFIYTEEGVESTKEYTLVTNPNGGPTLGFLKDSVALLEVEEDGYTYAFKDMNRNGEIDVFEDWRKSTEERAKDLSTKLSIEEQAGLTLFSGHQTAYVFGQEQKDFLDGNLRCVLNAASSNAEEAVKWVNSMQSYVEMKAKDNGKIAIPVNFSSDPRSTAGSGDVYGSSNGANDISKWPTNLGLAATFDTEQMYKFAKASSAEYRALGITTALGPQIDLSTEPRWLRVNGTFGEGTELSVAMTQAYVDGSQSTYDEEGNDLGWGRDSINCMIKHWVGEGAGEAGREGHTFAGKYGVYPGNNFDEHLKPFVEGGFNLQGKTKSAAAVMTSYTIGIKDDGNPIGNGRGSAYDDYKMKLLRDTYKFDGVVCTDWGVTGTAATELGVMSFGTGWGVESLTEDERHYAIIENGVDMFGGNNNAGPVINAYNEFVKNEGKEKADERFAKIAERVLTLAFNTGSFENPYLDMETSKSIVGSEEKAAAGYEAQLASVVMIKNKDNTIQSAANKEKAAKDMVVYIPYTSRIELPGPWGGPTPDPWRESLSIATAKTIYKEVITDTVTRGDDGMITKVETPDLSNVDMAIVGMLTPDNGNPFSGAGGDPATKSFYPLSLQYKPYTADGQNVRETSISEGDARAYVGKESNIFNAYDLTAFENTVAAVKATGKDIPVVVYMNTINAFIPAEFEADADAIVCGFSVSDQAVLEVINGEYEPKALLPFQLPKDMDTVEKQFEDVPRDMECYVDSLGNTYDFGFGLNWSGTIHDERLDLYKVVSHDTSDSSSNVALYVVVGLVALAGVAVVVKRKKHA